MRRIDETPLSQTGRDLVAYATHLSLLAAVDFLREKAYEVDFRAGNLFTEEKKLVEMLLAGPVLLYYVRAAFKDI